MNPDVHVATAVTLRIPDSLWFLWKVGFLLEETQGLRKQLSVSLAGVLGKPASPRRYVVVFMVFDESSRAATIPRNSEFNCRETSKVTRPLYRYDNGSRRVAAGSNSGRTSPEYGSTRFPHRSARDSTGTESVRVVDANPVNKALIPETHSR